MSRWWLYHTGTLEHRENIPAPQLTLSQVYYALLNTKQTSTGPNNIPFWVWKENAAILAPAVQAIWNLSLSTQRWPSEWKQANVYPLPKVDIIVQPQDFRGICITTVTARTFERVVCNTFGKERVESTWIITSLRTEEKAVVQTHFLKYSMNFSKL